MESHLLGRTIHVVRRLDDGGDWFLISVAWKDDFTASHQCIRKMVCHHQVTSVLNLVTTCIGVGHVCIKIEFLKGRGDAALELLLKHTRLDIDHILNTPDLM